MTWTDAADVRIVCKCTPVILLCRKCKLAAPAVMCCITYKRNPDKRPSLPQNTPFRFLAFVMGPLSVLATSGLLSMDAMSRPFPAGHSVPRSCAVPASRTASGAAAGTASVTSAAFRFPAAGQRTFTQTQKAPHSQPCTLTCQQVRIRGLQEWRRHLSHRLCWRRLWSRL